MSEAIRGDVMECHHRRADKRGGGRGRERSSAESHFRTLSPLVLCIYVWCCPPQSAATSVAAAAPLDHLLSMPPLLFRLFSIPGLAVISVIFTVDTLAFISIVALGIVVEVNIIFCVRNMQINDGTTLLGGFQLSYEFSFIKSKRKQNDWIVR